MKMKATVKARAMTQSTNSAWVGFVKTGHHGMGLMILLSEVRVPN
jgi:hypothetical protein